MDRVLSSPLAWRVYQVSCIVYVNYILLIYITRYTSETVWPHCVMNSISCFSVEQTKGVFEDF